MAALAASAVSLESIDYGPQEWFPCGVDNRTILTRRLVLVLTGQGGQTNTIGASVLGFDKLLSTQMLFDDTNNVGYPACVDPVNNVLLLFDGVPTDVTTTVARVTVTGTVKSPGAA